MRPTPKRWRVAVEGLGSRLAAARRSVAPRKGSRGGYPESVGESLDVLARRCFEQQAEEEERKLNSKLSHLTEDLAALEKKRAAVGGGCGSLLVGVVLFSLVGSFNLFLGLVGGALALMVWSRNAFSGEKSGIARDASDIRAKIRATHSRVRAARSLVGSKLDAYQRGEPREVRTVRSFAIEGFRERIERQRARTLGRDSEWSQAREDLDRHRDEVQRSAAYWRERRREEPDSELPGVHLGMAKALDAKLREAVGKVDARAAVLRRFYNDCEAKLTVLDRRNRDIEESRRLADLSDRADVVIEEAERTIENIAHEFLRDAVVIEWALTGADNVGVQSLTAERSLESIESLADEVINASERQRSAVEVLTRKLAR